MGLVIYRIQYIELVARETRMVVRQPVIYLFHSYFGEHQASLVDLMKSNATKQCNLIIDFVFKKSLKRNSHEIDALEQLMLKVKKKC